ncbi:MAG: hypothetical protein O3C21_14585 [Verrucomicrobia bacterium]|nr:hypothetical protein [Verrucomicrobiota bacterium]
MKRFAICALALLAIWAAYLRSEEGFEMVEINFGTVCLKIESGAGVLCGYLGGGGNGKLFEHKFSDRPRSMGLSTGVYASFDYGLVVGIMYWQLAVVVVAASFVTVMIFILRQRGLRKTISPKAKEM